jgi:hypothetical protein
MAHLRILFFISIIMAAATTKAQTWEVGLGAGGAGYIGDLNPKNPVKISGFSAGAYVKTNFDPYWGLGLHYQYGEIRANDANSSNEQFRQRNLNFHTPLHEVSLQLDFNFFDYFAGGGRKNFSPYAFLGVGGVFFSPRATYTNPTLGMDKEEVRLAFYQTEGPQNSYRGYTVTVPYGVGVHFKLKENWGLFSQVGYRTAFTDYLDDVGDYYPESNPWDATGNELAKRRFLSNPADIKNYSNVGSPHTQRGDLRKRDTYMFVNVGVSYTFSSSKCYIF